MKHLILFAAILQLLLGTVSAADLTIRYLNVGQGDAVLVTTPDGKSMLYDAGRSKTQVASEVAKAGVKRLDLAVASHADADHIAGFETVAAQFQPRTFLNNGLAGSTETFARVVAAMKKANAQGLVASERTIGLGTDVKLHVFPPPANAPKGNQNANSIGMLLEYGKFKAFFGGDSEPIETKFWASKYANKLLNLDVYKSAHHGSKTNDTLEWLRTLNPSNVVVSVGENNYGHPSREALELYALVNANVWRTDEYGTITVSIKANGEYRISTEGGYGMFRVAQGAALDAATPTATPTATPVANPKPSVSPTVPEPKLISTVEFMGSSLYLYDAPASETQGASPTLLKRVVVNQTTIYIYNGPLNPADASAMSPSDLKPPDPSAPTTDSVGTPTPVSVNRRFTGEAFATLSVMAPTPGMFFAVQDANGVVQTNLTNLDSSMYTVTFSQPNFTSEQVKLSIKQGESVQLTAPELKPGGGQPAGFGAIRFTDPNPSGFTLIISEGNELVTDSSNLFPGAYTVVFKSDSSAAEVARVEVWVRAGQVSTVSINTLGLNSPEHTFRGSVPGLLVAPVNGDLDCRDFPSQPEAQAFFDANGGVANDKFDLDRDHDGKPCEENEPWRGRSTSSLPASAPNPVATPSAEPVNTPVTTPSPSPNAGLCWVNGYTRKNGTYVSGYWRRC
jgi:competence protein ComEC